MEQRGDIAVKNQLLHTPEGVRDIYNEECERKIILEGRLLSVLKSYGYHPIQTPTFEFFDIFGKEIGTTPAPKQHSAARISRELIAMELD